MTYLIDEQDLELDDFLFNILTDLTDTLHDINGNSQEVYKIGVSSPSDIDDTVSVHKSGYSSFVKNITTNELETELSSELVDDSNVGISDDNDSINVYSVSTDSDGSRGSEWMELESFQDSLTKNQSDFNHYHNHSPINRLKRKQNDTFSHDSDHIQALGISYNVSSVDFLTLFYSAVNEGNCRKLIELSNQYIYQYCIVEFKCPSHTMVVNNGSYLPKFYEAVMNTHPDGVMSFRNVNSWKENGLCKVVYNLRFHGTRMYKTYISEFFRSNARLYELFDLDRLSEKQLKYYQALEEESIATGRFPIIFVKTQVLLIVDETTNRIKEYINNTRLSSFRLSQHVT